MAYTMSSSFFRTIITCAKAPSPSTLITSKSLNDMRRSAVPVATLNATGGDTSITSLPRRVVVDAVAVTAVPVVLAAPPVMAVVADAMGAMADVGGVLSAIGGVRALVEEVEEVEEVEVG